MKREQILFSSKPFIQLGLNDLYRLLSLRILVFVVEQDCPYLETDGLDQASLHILGKNEKGKLRAYARIVPPGISYPEKVAIGRVVTHPDVRRTGLGRELMHFTINEASKLYGNYPIQISAQQYLISFYESFDFEINTEPYLEDDIPHIGMIRKR